MLPKTFTVNDFLSYSEHAEFFHNTHTPNLLNIVCDGNEVTTKVNWSFKKQNDPATLEKVPYKPQKGISVPRDYYTSTYLHSYFMLNCLDLINKGVYTSNSQFSFYETESQLKIIYTSPRTRGIYKGKNFVVDLIFYKNNNGEYILEKMVETLEGEYMVEFKKQALKLIEN